ncbi:MAG: tetratricopeptide repeat-containing sensor histidine kinase [Bacteroidales bacterium]|jgi:signal transduction histidine kinase|nr:tetratricopeptide repeat-containing sensor histidine kinase [Bacteroidales bacterium]
MNSIYRLWIILLLFLGFIPGKESFSSNLDSLKKVIYHLPDDSVKVDRLTDLSYKTYKYSTDSAYVIVKEALRIAQDIGYTKGYASALSQLGVVYKYQSEYDSALFYYNKSLAIFDSLAMDYERAINLNRLGNVYKRFGNFDQSIDCFLSALEIFERLNDTLRTSFILNNLGVLYFDLGNFKEALNYYLSNLELLEKSGLTSDIHIIYMNIGNVYQQFAFFESDPGYLQISSEYFLKALYHLQDKSNTYDRFLLYHNLAVNSEDLERFDEARKFAYKAIELGKEVGAKGTMVYSIQCLGNTFIKEGNYVQGLKYLKESYEMARELEDVRQIHRLTKNLSDAYEKLGDSDQALGYLKEFLVYDDSVYSLNKKAQIVELEQKYEAEQRKQEIALLKAEKELQEAELAKNEATFQQARFKQMILFIAIGLAVCFIIYLWYDRKKRKKINQLLALQNKKITSQQGEIAKQNNELLEANKTKDKLFQIIAHDLRSPLISIDSIAQLIPIWIEEQDYDSLRKLSNNLELSVTNLLTLIDNLLNWALSQQGKIPYKPETFNVKEVIDEAIDLYRSSAELKNIALIDEVEEDILIFADKNMVHTIFRNLINNAIKFTPEKGEVYVGSSARNKYAQLWVKDTGIGIKEEHQRKVFELANGDGNEQKSETGKGLGLFFCKEFVKINQGDIFIESRPNQGTTITFILPRYNPSAN